LVGLEKRASWYALRPISLVDLAMLLRQADRIIAVAGVAPDRHSFRSLAPDLEEPREATGRPRLHLIANLCGPRYEHLVRSYFEETVERRLAATALALRCYRLEHGGAFPPSLDDLVPTFLPAVPADPMVADRRLSYRSGGSDPVLYSLGADGKDDGASDAPADDLRCLVNDDWSGLTQRRDAVVHLFGPVGPHEPWRSRPIGE
jgi:hypothetical protein